MRIPIKYVFLSSLLLASSAQADTVWLTNGDRITGTIVLLDGGKLLLKTPYAGTLSLDAKQISTLESDQQFTVKQQREDHGSLARLDSTESGQVLVSFADSDAQLPLKDIHQLVPHKPKELISDLVWSGSVHLSADYKRKEKDSDKYDLDLDTQVRHGRWRHLVNADYEHETKDDSKTTDRFTGSYGLDYFLTQRWFWKGKGKYTHDRLEDLRRQSTLGTGPGFQFWENELGSLAASALLNHNSYSFANGSREHFKSLTGNWDYRRYFMAKTLEFYYKGEAGLPFTPAVDYTLDNETGLRYKLNSWASLSLRAEWEKVKSQQGDLNDRRYLMGVGVSW